MVKNILRNISDVHGILSILKHLVFVLGGNISTPVLLAQMKANRNRISSHFFEFKIQIQNQYMELFVHSTSTFNSWMFYDVLSAEDGYKPCCEFLLFTQLLSNRLLLNQDPPFFRFDQRFSQLDKRNNRGPSRLEHPKSLQRTPWSAFM